VRLAFIVCVLAKWRSFIYKAYSTLKKLNSFWNKTMLVPSGRYLKKIVNHLGWIVSILSLSVSLSPSLFTHPLHVDLIKVFLTSSLLRAAVFHPI
jgi:hypothetical protein